MTLESFASGQPTRVEVAAIERELTRLWKDAARVTDGEPAPVTRACLLNLLVLSRAAGGPERDRILAEVVQARPSRILLLEIDPDLGGDVIQAWISAQCVLPRGGGRQVCCEQVTIRVPRRGTKHLPGLISALTASDLPSCLWLSDGAPSDPAFLARLSPLADRVIVDSLRLDLAEMDHLTRRAASTSHPPVADLNWARLLPLQLGIAGLFDSPLMQPLLDRIDSVETAGGLHSDAAAALVSGWVSSALGRPRLRRRHEARPGAPEGRLTRLALETRDGSRAVVESEGVAGLWSSRAELPGACPLPRRSRFRERSTAELLCEELDRSGRNFLYESALTSTVAVA